MTVQSERAEQDEVVLGDVITLLNTCESQNEIFVDGRRGPVPSKEGQGRVDPFEVSSDVTEYAASIDTQHFPYIWMGVVQDDRVSSAAQGIRNAGLYLAGFSGWTSRGAWGRGRSRSRRLGK
jgi:hypothetical protein